MLGLEIGADDYLCKPFSMRELMARVKVLLRRATVADTAARSNEDASGLRPVVDRSAAAHGRVGRASVSLTVTEILLLQGLVRRPGIVKTREQLMQDAYPDRVSVSDRTIDSHVKRIRRKFQAVDPAFDRIEGVYGAGYRYRESDEPRIVAAAGSMAAPLAHRPRLLAFNLLLVFLPVAGILYLDVYETRLLEVQERGMVQQGRLVAAALGDREES